MDDKTRVKLEDINDELEKACSAALVLTLALDSISSDTEIFVGPAEFLFKAIERVEKRITDLIDSAKH